MGLCRIYLTSPKKSVYLSSDERKKIKEELDMQIKKDMHTQRSYLLVTTTGLRSLTSDLDDLEIEYYEIEDDAEK